MEVVIINFSLDGLSEAEYRAKCDEIAPAFAAVPGLVSKVWLADTAGGVYGGVYTFEDGAAVDAYMSSDLFEHVAATPDVRRRLRAPLRSARRTDRGHPGPSSARPPDAWQHEGHGSPVNRLRGDRPGRRAVRGPSRVGGSRTPRLLRLRDCGHWEVDAARTVRRGVCRSAASTSSRLTAEASSRRRRVFSARSDSSPARRGWTPSVVVIDNYEVFRIADPWLRHELLPRLGSSVRVVVAGREPPMLEWAIERGQLGGLEVLPLGPLDDESVREIVRSAGVEDGQIATAIMRVSRGHPLALRLALEARLARVDVPELDAMPRVVDALAGAFRSGLDARGSPSARCGVGPEAYHAGSPRCHARRG